MPQCLIYCRVSTEEQAEKGFSLDAQEKLCRDFAERSGFNVAGVYRDEGKSGTTLDRPALQDLLTKCTETKAIGAVIVQETDRLARNTHDHLGIRAMLQKAGAKLISVNQPMLDDSPEGKMIDTILASVNQFQSDLSGRKIRKALQEKLDQGWWPGWAPVGYLNVPVGEASDGRRAKKVVQNDPASWLLLQEGFRLYLTGDYSAEKLRDLLYRRGLRSKRGKKIAHSIMVGILKNPFYAGLMVWKGQRRIGRHEAMITLQEHARIQEIIAVHNMGASRERRHNFLLRGFAFCNRCGRRYTAEVHPLKNKSYYHCKGAHSKKHQNVEVAELEQQVAERFKCFQFNPRFVNSIVNRLTAISTQQRQTFSTKKQAALNQQKAIETRRDRAEEKLLAGVLSDDAFVRLRTTFAEQLQGLQEQLASLHCQRDLDTEVVREMLAVARDVYHAYQKAPAASKRQYLGLFWEKFLVENREIVKAVPSRLIRNLQEEQGIILGTSLCTNPTLSITLLDVADTFGRVYRKIGVQQHSTLRQAVLDVMADAGILAESPETWSKDLPAFGSIHAKLNEYAADTLNPQSRFASSAASHVSTLFVFNTFRPAGQKLAWTDMLRARNRVVIIQLKGLENSLERAVTEFLLWNLIGYIEAIGPGLLRCFVVLDEAHKLSFDRGSPVEKLLREGRKFGIGLLLASQQPEDFSQVAFANTATKLVFQVGDERSTISRQLHRKIKNTHSFGEIYQVITKLPRGYLVGPLDESERIPEKPVDRYHAGLLSPPQTPIDAEEDNQEPGDQEVESGVGESILALVNVRQQSAMGMTFQVEGPVRKLCLRVSWAGYVPEPDKENPHKVWWVRKPIEQTFDLVLSKKATRKPAMVGEIDGIRIYIVTGVDEGVFTVTTSLVNNRPLRTEWDRDDRIYQVRLEVSAIDQSAVFVARPPSRYLRDDEWWNFELLYRTRKAFAVGHGCAVQWESADGRRASRIWTEWVPEAEVLKATPEVLDNDPLLALDNLTDPSRRALVCGDLRRLPLAYTSWIKQGEDGLDNILKEFPEIHRNDIRKAAERNLKCCKEACQRIEKGITWLENDDLSWRAFCLANQAMVQSMRKSRRGEPRWFAFQMAFILLSLPSAVDPTHVDRTTFDLIWFPTGGGKTEAYLGLTAFCLFYRRLAATRPEDQEGTAVLTRYTLRLLTIQQFERAARLICACELVRRGREVELGAAEFSIGLFVGNTATPGSIEDARKLLAGDSVGDGNLTTLPLVRCPWCATELTTREQRIVVSQLLTRCPNPKCEFRQRVPVAVVDEEIFHHPPSMVVATVDKFARMAWVPEIKSLFGKGIPPRPPPMMIIQDELHLISDALGTVVALYETAIDHLCQVNGRPPKVIGSTATIRRAEDQCWGLFQRKAVPFPSSGLLASDSFFYREDTSQPGRLYVGVHAQGRSPKFSLARLVGTLCQLAGRISDLKTRDSFHTLVLYFNSLRELGGALVMAEDEVPRYVQSMPRNKGETARQLIHIQELTSHIPSGSIPDVLKKIEEPLPGLPGSTMQREPLDLVLATNMISVGIDVDRLGLMVVNGQPKTTAEYIQATSRVGRPRGSAGMVVTLYNWTRPRDRSHYERFLPYHQTFYRFVEPTSVTPFSERARDRALHAVLVSLARLLLDEFQGKDSAKKITDLDVQRRVRELAEIIVARAQKTDPSELEDTKTHLEELVDEWVEEAEGSNDLFWEKTRFMQGKRALLRAAEVENIARGLWATPNSMRDVEPPSPVLLYTNKRITERGGTDGAETGD